MPEQTTTHAETSTGFLNSKAEQYAEIVRALDAHAGLIIASAARVLGNMADAEDVAQDIAEKLLKARPQAIRNWPAYLRTLAVNQAVDRLRRRKDWTSLEDPPAAGNPETDAYNAQRADILRRAIGRLSERDGRLFSMYYFGDLTHGDIASQLNMTTNAVGVALHRIRAHLAAQIGEGTQ
jgi:RNA polymerase sigma factor (sigma-70 family)